MLEQWTCLSCQRPHVLRGIYDQLWVSRKKGNEIWETERGWWWDGGMRRELLNRRRLCLFKPFLSYNVHFSLSPHLHLHSLLPSSSGEVSPTCPFIKDNQMECKICSWVLREREGFLWGSPCPTSTPPSLSSIQTTHNSSGQLTVPSWSQRTQAPLTCPFI